MKIQELNKAGRPRKDVPPKEVSPQFWERLQKTKVGRKRYKVVKDQPEKKVEKIYKPKIKTDE